nr:hypothetical protein [Tanacetum cinerariifolium]
MNLDDLYNHLKVYEAEVQKKSNSNPQDVAFISSSKNRSNKDGNTACVTTASTVFPTGSVNVATICQDTPSAYIASQSNGSQIKFEDINQIDEDDIEEMDIKWSMALLSMRADKFRKRTRKKISIQGSDVAGFDKSKVECFNCHKMGYFARECRAPKSQERGRKESYRQGSKAEEKSSIALMAIDGVGWDWSYMANEEDHALVADGEAPTEFALMANTESKDINQIDEDDIGEIDIKWNMALLSMRADRYWKRTRKKISIQGTDVAGFDKSKSNGSQIKFEDINQIDEDDIEEMDIKWSMALLSMRADKFRKRTRKKISIQGSDVAGFDKSKVECFNCHKMGYFARECRAPKSQERGRKESYRQGSKAEEKSSIALMAIDGVGWDWSYMANEEDHALVADGEAPTEFALMANTESKVFDISLCSNECKKNTDSLNSKIKDLKSELSEANNYIYHYKLAVAQLEGKLTEYKEREVKYIENFITLEMYRSSNLKSIKALDKELEEVKLKKDGLDGKLAGLLKASKNLDHLIKSQRSDQVKEGVGYNAVPPPAADLYLSPKKDLSWTGLPEFVDDTITEYSRPSPTIASTLAEGQNKDSSTSEDVASPNPPKPFVKFVKPKDSQPKRKSTE